MTDEEIRQYVDSRINAVLNNMVDIGQLPTVEATSGMSLPFVSDGQLVSATVDALVDKSWGGIVDLPKIMAALADKKEFVQAITSSGSILTVNGVDGTDGTEENAKDTEKKIVFNTVGGKSIISASGISTDIAIPSIGLAAIQSQLANYAFSTYSDLEMSEQTLTWNSKEFAQLGYKTASSAAEFTPMRIWAWGDFVLRNGQLLNFSTGARSLLLKRDTSTSGATSTWYNLDKISIVRASSEPVTLENPASSSVIKLTTSGLTDTIDITTSTNLLSNTMSSNAIVLSVPRSCYIDAIRFYYSNKVTVSITAGGKYIQFTQQR